MVHEAARSEVPRLDARTAPPPRVKLSYTKNAPSSDRWLSDYGVGLTIVLESSVTAATRAKILPFKVAPVLIVTA